MATVPAIKTPPQYFKKSVVSDISSPKLLQLQVLECLFPLSLQED
jgi:hypothetical protein